MARTRPSGVISALGFSSAVQRTYDRVLRQSGRNLGWVAAAVQRAPDELVADLSPLVERGIVRIVDDLVHVESPAELLSRLIAEQAEAAARARADLSALATALPLLTATTARPDEGDVRNVEQIDGEISSGGEPSSLIGALIRQSKGDLAWLRPDQWRIPREGAMLEVIRDLVGAGRRSRAIYPVRVLTEAPEVVRGRAAAGEQVRVLPDVPTRMFVIGTTHAVLPEPLGFVDEPRTLVRQQGIVEALAMLFEMMWERASPVPELEPGDTPDLRGFLLRQLASGAQDERIARQLGISLRTVRRRVADLMAELGADSRFQAGVEAVRRGWL
jgi:hypothetical protein